MSLEEAKKDGVKTKIVKGELLYLVKCHYCGCELLRKCYKPNFNYSCSYCKLSMSGKKEKPNKEAKEPQD